MKTKEELNVLKEEVETVSRKLHELSVEELEQVMGGLTPYEEYLRRLSVIELNNLIKEIEEEFGVSTRTIGKDSKIE